MASERRWKMADTAVALAVGMVTMVYDGMVAKEFYWDARGNNDRRMTESCTLAMISLYGQTAGLIYLVKTAREEFKK